MGRQMLEDTNREGPEGILASLVVVADAATVIVRGEIDLSNSDQLRTCLAACLTGGAKRLTVNMAAVDFIDATGLKILAWADQRLEGTGELTVSKPSPFVRRVISLSGLDRLLDLETAEPRANGHCRRGHVKHA
jgi:anti-anti-sigma factor